MNNPNLPDNMQSLTDMSLPWNVDECDCGAEVVANEAGKCNECGEEY